ncbi:MAG: isopeptide-forming domain-containing fimbrial protein [Pseudomonadota bacterium]
MTVLPKFELLEDRIVLDGEAQVTVDAPADVEIGAQDVEFTLTFDNVDPTDTGFVPFIDVILPTLGPDGDDGVTFDGATFLGGSVVTTEIVFDAAGEALHPIALDSFGDPLVVTGTPGDTLLVFELPFGSFSAGNPPVDVVMTLDFSDQADLDEEFVIQTRGGFAFGGDPLNNPQTDPSTVSAFGTTTVGQTLFDIQKQTLSGGGVLAENEAATGPSYVYTYQILVDVAPGQTLTDFNLVDNLPPEIVYLGNLSVSPAADVNVEPTAGQIAGPGNDLLDLTFASITGTAVVTFDYFIDEFAANETDPTLNDSSGDPAPVQNGVQGSGTWDPLDEDDATQSVSDSALNEIEAVSLAVQKGVAVFEDTDLPGVVSPGDVYEFTLDIQVSDYFTYGDLVITDILGNGWEYLNAPGFTPTLTTVESNGGSLTSEVLTPNESTSFDTATGETTVVWDISQALLDAGQDAFLTGDDADGTVNLQSTTATISYFARVLDEFVDDGDVGDIAFNQGDLLQNNAQITATVRDNDTPTTVLGTESDETGAGIQTPFGFIESKSVAFLNGVAPDPDVPIAAGDQVTFSIIYNAPLGAFEQLNITDNLPQNVFDAAELTVFNNVVSAGPPAPGEAQFGLASQAYIDAGGGIPALSNVPADNQIDFDFGTFTSDPRGEVQIEILFTTTVIDAVFEDGLLLTNQATAFESNSTSSSVDTTAIANFIFSQPDLEITKGVIATDSVDPSTSFTDPVGPVSFSAPGSAGARFSDTISSDSLGTTPVDANVENIDAGDIVSFAIVVENTGQAPNGAFDVQIEDTLPPGFVIPASGLNLTVTDGTGSRVIGFTGDLFSGGILLDDRGSEGALSAFDPTAGDNLVVITYDLEAAQSVTSNDVIENTATVANFAAFESTPSNTAINRATPDLTDDASASVEDVQVSKRLVDREFGVQGNSEVLVGEEFTFEVEIDLQEATYENAVLSDTVRSGGAFGDFEILSAEITGWDTSVLTSSNGITLGSAGAVAADGNSVSFDLGTLVNLGNNDVSDDVITFEVTARSLGSQDEGAGDRLANTGRFQADGVSSAASNGVNLIEPQLTIDKSASPNIVQAGETVSYQIVVDNPIASRDAPAFDLELTDLLDPNVVLVAGSVNVVGGTGVSIVNGNGTGDTDIEITADELGVNDTLTITYEATVLASVESGIIIDNTANVTFDSLPTDDADDERDFSISDDAEVATAAASIDKSITDTSNADTDGGDLSIGETVTYDITIVLPEGTNSNATLVDTLPTTPGTLTLVSSEVISIGDNITGSLLAAGAAGTVVGDDVVFEFGTLSNVNDLVQNGDDEIVVRIVAQLNDLPDNMSGDTLVNTARFITDNTDVSDTAVVEVVEPVLGIDKVADVSEADAGDTVTYTITSSNSGNGPAYDIVLDDGVVDPSIVAGTPPVASIRILDGATDVTPSLGADAPSVTFPTGTGGLQAIVPVLLPGQTIEVVFETVVVDAVAFDSTFSNEATITRFDTDPAGDTTDPDDGRVFTGPSDSVEIDTPPPGIEKTLVGTDDPNTLGADVGVSETLTYEIELTLPEGTSDILVVDDLPEGLTPISAVITTMDASITSDNLAQGDSDISSGFISVGSDGGFEFDFGTVTNPGDNLAANDAIVLTVTAQVADVVTVSDGVTLTNEATISLIDPLSGAVLIDPDTGAPQSFSDDASANVVEPELDIDKTVLPTTADAGDTVAYTILSQNIGSGPAYDVVLNDPLSDAGLTIPTPAVGSIRILDGGADVTPIGTDAPVLVYPTGAGGLQATIPVLLPGQTIEIAFEAVVADAVTFSTDVVNTAEVTRFDTDPAGDGTDGDDGRVFDDTLAGYVVPEDGAVVTTPDATLAKVVVATSDSDTTGTDVGIGETVTYELTITVPEGTADLVLSDALPSGLTAISAEVISLGSGGNITTDNINAGDTDASGSIVLTSSSVSFDFGTVQLAATDDAAAVDETIVVRVVAQVDDIASNADGATLENDASLDVNDPTTGAPLQPDPTASAVVEIVEPDLTIDKSGPIAANPGDVVPYVVTITNTGTGPAHDVFFEDLLSDPELALTGTPSFEIDSTTITPAVTLVGDGFSALIGSLQPGETLTVTYDAVLATTAPEAQSFPNIALIEYDTVPDGDPDTPGARSFTDQDDHAVATVPVVSKEATGSSLTPTGSGEFDGTDFDLVVGEEVTYTLTLVLPEVSMDSVVLQDTLPDGLAFVSAGFVSQGGQVSGADDVVINNSGAVTTFDFGTVDNTADGALNTDDQVIVELTAVVVDVAAAIDGASLINTSTLDVIAAGGIVLDQASDTAAVDIVEPELAFEKSGSEAADAGDQISYQIEIENTGTGPAFDIFVADTLSDPNISLTSGSVVATLNGTATALTVDETGDGFSFTFGQLLPNDILVVTYDADVAAGFAAGDIIENTATAEFDTVPDGDPSSPDGRTDTVEDDHVVGAGPLLTKTTVDSGNTDTGDGAFTSGVPDLVVGETVTFALTVTLPEISIDGATLVDTLPDGLSFVSASVDSVGVGLVGADAPAISGAGQTVTIEFGAIENPFDGSLGADDEVVVLVTALVEDIATNADGAVLTNSATLTLTPEGQAPLDPVTATTDVEIVEPDLEITKDGSIAVNPGDDVDYTLSITNSGTGPAYDILVEDELDNTFLSFNSGSLIASIDGTDITGSLSLVETATGFEVIIPALQPGETLEIGYSALLDASAPEAQSFPNLASISFDTVPDGDPNSPTGRGDSDDDDFSVATVPFIVKSPIATDFGDTTSDQGDADLFDLTVGETVTYRYEVFLPEIAMDSVVLTDVLGPELELIAVDVVSFGAGISAANTDPIVTSVDPQNFSIDFGAVNNPADGTIGPDDVIVLEVQARVLDVPTAASGQVVDNTVTVNVDPAGPAGPLAPATDTAQVEIVDPNLTLDKAGPLAVNPGETATYTLTLNNTGDGPAYDVLIEDQLADGNLSLVSGSVSLSLDGMPVSITPSETGTGFDVLVPVILPGQTLVVTYDALLSDTAPAAESFGNTATASFDTVPDGDPDSPTGRSDVITDEFEIATIPVLEKLAVDTGEASTGTGQGDGAIFDLSVGETVTYQLTLTLPEIDLSAIEITDTLPPGLSFVSASVDSVGADIALASPAIINNSGATTTISLGASTSLGDGTINTEDQVVIEIVAVVADVAAAADGALLTNTSTLTITPEGEAPLETQTDTADVEVVEPDLSIEKDGEIAADPGDTVTYTIEVVNSGTGPAFDIVVTDVLGDPNLVLNAVTGATINGSDVLGSLTITPNGTGFETLVDALQPGETLLITYDVDLLPGAPNAESFPNTATIEFDTVPDGDPATPGARTGTDEDDHSVATVPFLFKNTAFTSQAATGAEQFDADTFDLSIGEEVTYTLDIFLPEILLDSVVLTDTLPDGLTFVSANLVSTGANLTGADTPTISNVGQDILFDFGSVNNAPNGDIGTDDRITVEVTAVVADDPANTAGVALTNAAELNVDPAGAAAFDPVNASATVEVVEPEIDFEKSGPLAANPGDVVPYTLTFENTGSGPAYDIQVIDTLTDSNLTLVSGSVSVVIDGVTQAVTVDETTGFSLLLPELLPGQEATVSYEAILGISVDPASTTLNTASILFDTVPDGDPETPTGRTLTEMDDHGVATIPALSKTAIDGENPDTGTDAFDPALLDLTIGEQVTYELVLTLPEIDMDSVVLTDALPPGLAFVSASVTSVGTGIVAGAPIISEVGGFVTIDLGSISNPFDGSIGQDDEIRVEVVSVVTDDPAAFAGATLTNTGALTVTPQGEAPLDTQQDTATIEVVEPELSIDKTVNDLDPLVGDTITYTVVVTNAATATAPIYNAVVTDALPFQLSVTGGTVVSDPALATVTSGSAAGETVLTISIPRLLPGESVTITYDVFVGFQTDVLTGVTNVASVTGTSSPDPTNPFNRETTTQDDAFIIAQPIPGDEEEGDFFPTLGIDDAQFLPVLAIDPIYSGTAEPGSNVTIRLFGEQGQLTGIRHVLADAGGHWIAIFPTSSVETVYDDFFSEFKGSEVFDLPVELLDRQPIQESASLGEVRFAEVGTDLNTESYYVSISVDRPSTLPQDNGAFNARTFYASAFNQQAFSVGDTLRVDEVFENVAGLTVQSLYEASLNPLGDSLNRFNYEFLTGATATPGSAY